LDFYQYNQKTYCQDTKTLSFINKKQDNATAQNRQINPCSDHFKLEIHNTCKNKKTKDKDESTIFQLQPNRTTFLQTMYRVYHLKLPNFLKFYKIRPKTPQKITKSSEFLLKPLDEPSQNVEINSNPHPKTVNDQSISEVNYRSISGFEK